MMTAAAAPSVSTGHRRRAALLGAAVVLLLVLAATLAGAAALGQLGRLTSQPRVGVDDAVPLVALLVLAAALGWLSVILVVSCCGLLRPQHPRYAPLRAPLATRLAVVLLAATAFGSVSAATSATAHPGIMVTATVPRATGVEAPPSPAPVPDFAPRTSDSDRAGTRPPAQCDVPEPGWTSAGPRLQRPTSTDQAGLLGQCGAGGPDAEVVVLRGDSLWSIVERQLGPDASPAQIAATWPAWHAANRALIGPDPDVLLPGTILHRPAQEVLR